jgi:hypothetical protein
LHLRKIEEGSFFINKVTFNEFITPHNFHELPWNIRFHSTNNAKKINMWSQG